MWLALLRLYSCPLRHTLQSHAGVLRASRPLATRWDLERTIGGEEVALSSDSDTHLWFKCVGRNKYAMFDEVARERGTWDDLCLEPQKRAFARRGLCKLCRKYYDDKGLEAHENRHHLRPPSQDSEREA